MLRYILIIFVLFLFSNNMVAQNIVGYQGKRFLAEYNFQPSFFGILRRDKLNAVHNFHIGFVATKRIQLGIAYDIYSPEIANRNDLTVKGTAFGANVDFYIKNNRAPVGPFVRAEIRFLNAENSLNETIERPSIGGGFGIRRIIRDRFTVNFGAMLGWVKREDSMGGFVQVKEIIGEKEVQNLYFYRLHLGVGALLF